MQAIPVERWRWVKPAAYSGMFTHECHLHDDSRAKTWFCVQVEEVPAYEYNEPLAKAPPKPGPSFRPRAL